MAWDFRHPIPVRRHRPSETAPAGSESSIHATSLLRTVVELVLTTGGLGTVMVALALVIPGARPVVLAKAHAVERQAVEPSWLGRDFPGAPSDRRRAERPYNAVLRLLSEP